MMAKSFRGLIGFLIIFNLFASLSSAEYATWIEVLEGNNGYVNDTGVLQTDTYYNWGLNITGSNITSVSVNGHALSNISDAGETTADWQVKLVAGDVADFGDNCTYTDIVFTIVNTHNGTDYINTTTQNNVTVIPCIESSTAAVNGMTIVDLNTTVLTLSDGVASSTVVWMPGLAENAENSSCYYGCTNFLTCSMDRFYLNGTTSVSDHCLLTVARSATNVGVVTVDVDSSISVAAPSNIPGLVLAGGILAILVSGEVVRRKRRGSIKSA